MSNVFQEPRTQFIGDDGLPLVNGTVTFYAAGTSNLIDTYLDSSGQAKNTNPVILDSQGRASIWLEPETYYKIVLKTSAGSTLKTDDNVLGVRLAAADPYTLAQDLNVNGKSIISSSASDLNIYLTPNGSGRTVITNAALQNNLDGAGYKLQFASGSGFSAVTSGNKLLYFTTISGATTYLQLKNAATGNTPGIQVTGNSANQGIILKPKGTGKVNVSGTSNYETNIENLGISNYAAIVTHKFLSDRMALISGASVPTVATYCMWTASGTALSIALSKNISSITDSGVGIATVNFTASYSAKSYLPVGMTLVGTTPITARYATLYTRNTNNVIIYSYNSTTGALADLASGTRGGFLILGSLT